MRVAVVSAALVALTGCKGSCRQLSERLCDCLQRPAEKEACLRRAASEDARVQPTAEQELVCAEKLQGCDCNTIDTEEGKRACGLAR